MRRQQQALLGTNSSKQSSHTVQAPLNKHHRAELTRTVVNTWQSVATCINPAAHVLEYIWSLHICGA
jgi:hypothetical protein